MSKTEPQQRLSVSLPFDTRRNVFVPHRLEINHGSRLSHYAQEELELCQLPPLDWQSAFRSGRLVCP